MQNIELPFVVDTCNQSSNECVTLSLFCPDVMNKGEIAESFLSFCKEWNLLYC